eukprot:symbB.v1.2.041574.t1/scaffold8364.1/size6656/1
MDILVNLRGLVRFPRESGAIGPLVFVPQLLMSGTFIPVQAIPQFLRWMQYVSFLQYAVKLLAIVEFRRLDLAREVVRWYKVGYGPYQVISGGVMGPL